MPADPNQDRPGLSTELTDSDITIEVSAGVSSPTTPQLAAVQSLEEAIGASYRALAGTAQLRLDTLAVLNQVAKRSLSVSLRVQLVSGDQGAADASLLKFLARGTLAIIAWMDGSPTLQLADLQQAIRVLAWGTSITTSAHPVLPSSADLVNAIAAWQKAKGALGSGDRVRIVTNNGSTDLDLGKKISDARSLLLARKLVN